MFVPAWVRASSAFFRSVSEWVVSAEPPPPLPGALKYAWHVFISLSMNSPDPCPRLTTTRLSPQRRSRPLSPTNLLPHRPRIKSDRFPENFPEIRKPPGWTSAEIKNISVAVQPGYFLISGLYYYTLLYLYLYSLTFPYFRLFPYVSRSAEIRKSPGWTSADICFISAEATRQLAESCPFSIKVFGSSMEPSNALATLWSRATLRRCELSPSFLEPGTILSCLWPIPHLSFE